VLDFSVSEEEEVWAGCVSSFSSGGNNLHFTWGWLVLFQFHRNFSEAVSFKWDFFIWHQLSSPNRSELELRLRSWTFSLGMASIGWVVFRLLEFFMSL
jgi:hypothetical protein